MSETFGKHNQENSARKLNARTVIKQFEGVSQKFTPIVATARAVLPVTKIKSTHSAIKAEGNLIRNAVRTRKQLDVYMSPLQLVDTFIQHGSESIDHERIICVMIPEKSHFWLADRTFKITQKFFQL